MTNRRRRADIDHSPDATNRTTQGGPSPTGLPCHYCRTPTREGYCDTCQGYPLNVAYQRRGECGHRVPMTGWCMSCRRTVAHPMVPERGFWVREPEERVGPVRSMGDLSRMQEQILTKHQRPAEQRDIEAEKAAIARMEAEVAEEVPF